MVILLYIQYVIYLFLFKRAVLETKTELYHISPEAVRGFYITLNNIVFTGTKDGEVVTFSIPLNDVVQMTSEDEL